MWVAGSVEYWWPLGEVQFRVPSLAGLTVHLVALFSVWCDLQR